MKTTECNEATFPSSGHRDSPPSMPSLAAHAQAFSPSPPYVKQHASFPPLPCAPFLEPRDSPLGIGILEPQELYHRTSKL